MGDHTRRAQSAQKLQVFWKKGQKTRVLAKKGPFERTIGGGPGPTRVYRHFEFFTRDTSRRIGLTVQHALLRADRRSVRARF